MNLSTWPDDTKQHVQAASVCCAHPFSVKLRNVKDVLKLLRLAQLALRVPDSPYSLSWIPKVPLLPHCSPTMEHAGAVVVLPPQ